jgi:hypothetical protein
MPFTTTQWAILALVLVAGWLLGLASHSGGRKWRERYTAERDAHAAYRRDADTKVAEAKREADARAAEADRRRAEAEREHARLASAAPVTAATVTPTTTAAYSAQPAYPARATYASGTARPKRGWFDWR